MCRFCHAIKHQFNSEEFYRDFDRRIISRYCQINVFPPKRHLSRDQEMAPDALQVAFSMLACAHDVNDGKFVPGSIFKCSNINKDYLTAMCHAVVAKL